MSTYIALIVSSCTWLYLQVLLCLKIGASVDLLRFVDSMESVVSIALFIIKDDDKMIQCSSCNHFEHLACRGRIHEPPGDNPHTCNYCAFPDRDLTVFF